MHDVVLYLMLLVISVTNSYGLLLLQWLLLGFLRLLRFSHRMRLLLKLLDFEAIIYL